MAGSDEPPAPWEPDEDATASINYTSGTTARPKGVQLTHRTLWLHAASIGWHLGVGDPRTSTCRHAADVPLQRLGHPVRPRRDGRTAGDAAASVDGAEILRRVERRTGVTLSAGAPAVLERSLDAARPLRERGEPVPGHGRMRVLVGGAAPPPSHDPRASRRSSAGSSCTATASPRPRPCSPSTGAPAEWRRPGGRRARRACSPARACRRSGVRLRVDGHGEVLARSNHVLEGYWDDPDASAAALADGWLHTGDGGRHRRRRHL